MEVLTAIAIGLTFAAGVFQILRRNMVRAVIGLMMLTNAVTLFLLSTGAYDCDTAAYIGPVVGVRCDALPQALILTAIVISLGMAAVALALLYLNAKRYRVCDSDELTGLKR